MTDVPAELKLELAVMVKLAFVAPAGTVTELGTVATEVVAEFSVTTMPPVGAAAERNTQPVEVPPTAIALGLIVRAVRFSG